MRSAIHLLSALGLSVFTLASPSFASAQDETPEAWAKYDFVPGEKVLYFEDLSGSTTTVALRRLTEATPRLSVEPREGMMFLHIRPPAGYVAVLTEKLPDRFTIDFDMNVEGDNANGVRMTVMDGGVADPAAFDCSQHAVSVANSGGGGKSVKIDRAAGLTDLGQRTFHCSLTVDGSRARAYIDKVQMLDIPNTAFGRSDKIHIQVLGSDDSTHIDENAPVWLTNVRVAAGGNSLGYDELMKTGRLATHGILFTTASDHIRPESAPTLRSIGEMLKAHADLKLSIEGHTDNVGLAPDNQLLSERRAAAVVAWLIDNYGINKSRLTSVGFGSTRPIAPNVSVIGRQQNRRVELVKR